MKRIEVILTLLLSIYSLLSLSVNSWFHNVNEIYLKTSNSNPSMQLYSHAFQASFAFDILIFVWSLFGLLIARKPLKFLCRYYSLFLMLLCIGKLVSTSIFLGNSDIKEINDKFKEEYDFLNRNDKLITTGLKSWKASYENMYASVILELFLSGVSGFLLNYYSLPLQVTKNTDS